MEDFLLRNSKFSKESFNEVPWGKNATTYYFFYTNTGLDTSNYLLCIIEIIFWEICSEM